MAWRSPESATRKLRLPGPGEALPGLDPARRRAHVCDAERGVAAVDAADVFVDELGLVAGGGDSGGL